MKKHMKTLFTFLFIIIASTVALSDSHAREIKIASWNLSNLEAETNWQECRSSHYIPCRDDRHYNKLAEYARTLDADVIALQEVNGERAIQRVFSKDKYSFYFSRRHHNQKTGFAVRKDISVIQHDDLTALNIDRHKRSGGQRHATDITIEVDGTAIRLLSVHLKSSCLSAPLTSSRFHCTVLRRQVPVLENWIVAQTERKVPFAILGDFNRRFEKDRRYNKRGSMWKTINSRNNLSQVTLGHKPTCWGQYSSFIDHILLDERATHWLKPNSFSHMVFTGEKKHYNRSKISDHCPISATLNIE